MKTEKKTIGAFEAKTHLSQILDDVQKGNEVTITRRGKPVACIIPCPEDKPAESRKKTALNLKKIRESVRGPVNIQEMIKEGRKH